MTEFYLPKQRPSKRPFGLTASEIELLQRYADGEKWKEMAETRDASCLYNVSMFIRAKLGASHNGHAIAIAMREGIIK